MQEMNVGIFVLSLCMAALGGYLLGSINSAILLCRAVYGQDVRELGSGNAGMTNVARNFGKRVAALTLMGDLLKGVLAVFLGWCVVRFLPTGMDPLYGKYIGGIFAIVGHMLPLYFGFKGGKGVATSGGVILAIQPVLFLALISIFLVIFAISKMVSLASIIGISLYPVVTLLWCWLFSKPALVFCTASAAILAGLVVYMHRENIGRIRSGTEYRFGQKKQ